MFAAFPAPVGRASRAEPVAVRGVAANRGRRGVFTAQSREGRQEWLDPLSVSFLVSIAPWKNTFWNCISVPYCRGIKVSNHTLGDIKVFSAARDG